MCFQHSSKLLIVKPNLSLPASVLPSPYTQHEVKGKLTYFFRSWLVPFPPRAGLAQNIPGRDDEFTILHFTPPWFVWWQRPGRYCNTESPTKFFSFFQVYLVEYLVEWKASMTNWREKCIRSRHFHKRAINNTILFITPPQLLSAITWRAGYTEVQLCTAVTYI